MLANVNTYYIILQNLISVAFGVNVLIISAHMHGYKCPEHFPQKIFSTVIS